VGRTPRTVDGGPKRLDIPRVTSRSVGRGTSGTLLDMAPTPVEGRPRLVPWEKADLMYLDAFHVVDEAVVDIGQRMFDFPDEIDAELDFVGHLLTENLKAAKVFGSLGRDPGQPGQVRGTCGPGLVGRRDKGRKINWNQSHVEGQSDIGAGMA